MRLSEIMSQMSLTIYPEIGLVLFLGIFIVAVRQVFAKSKQGDWEQASRLALQNDTFEPHQEGSSR